MTPPNVLFDTRVEIHNRVVIRRFQGVHSTFLGGNLITPPPCYNRTYAQFRQLQPPTEHIFLHKQILRPSNHIRSKSVALRPNKVHIKTRRNELRRVLHVGRTKEGIFRIHCSNPGSTQHCILGDLRRQMQLQPFLNGINLRQLARGAAVRPVTAVHHIEVPWIVKLMHRLFDTPTQAPCTVTSARKRTQCMQQPGHDPPSHLQAFERVTCGTNVTSQHHMERHILWVMRHHDTRPYMLGQLNTLAAVIISQHQSLIWKHLTDRGRKHKSPAAINHMTLTLFFATICSLAHSSLQITARSTHRIDALVDPVLLEHAMAHCKTLDVLRERDRILSKLPQTCARHRHEIDLHVLQCHQHGLRNRRTVKQIFEIMPRKPKAGIHMIPLRPARHNHRPFRVAALLLQLLVHVLLTPQTCPSMQRRHSVHPIQRRQFIPTRHLDATRRESIHASLQDLHVFRHARRRLVRRVKRRKPLPTLVAVKQTHVRQDRVHRLRRTQRILPQLQIILRHAHWHPLQGHDLVLLLHTAFPHSVSVIHLRARACAALTGPPTQLTCIWLQPPRLHRGRP